MYLFLEILKSVGSFFIGWWSIVFRSRKDICSQISNIKKKQFLNFPISRKKQKTGVHEFFLIVLFI
jgi:hypothetical protein